MWHLGKRDVPHTCHFVRKVRRATPCKRFQISTDGWEAYERAIEMGLSDRASYARIVKVTGKERLEAVLGRPDLRETGTSYIERYNSTLRVTPAMAAGLAGHPVDDPGVVGGGLYEESTAIILLLLVSLPGMVETPRLQAKRSWW